MANQTLAHQTSPLRPFAVSLEVQSEVETFLNNWVASWNSHDAQALAALHTDDAMTINRYGTLIRGRADAEQALSFLLGPQGPFGDVVFPPMHITALREVSPGVTIVQATWNAPVLGADGRTVDGESNEMILSYTLLKHGSSWKTCQIDGHNVEPMELPYSSAEQRK